MKDLQVATCCRTCKHCEREEYDWETVPKPRVCRHPEIIADPENKRYQDGVLVKDVNVCKYWKLTTFEDEIFENFNENKTLLGIMERLPYSLRKSVYDM